MTRWRKRFDQTGGEHLLKAILYSAQACKALREEGYRVNAIAPQAAIYLTVQLELNGQHTPEGERLSNTQMITQYLLEEAGVALVPFNAFGASKKSNWYRLSVGTASMEDIENFFAKLRKALDQLT